VSITTRVPLERLATYFGGFTRRFLRADSMDAVDVEFLSPSGGGDQHAIEGARLVGITYDPRANTLELSFETGDHRFFEPREVWSIEESDGFLSAIEVILADQSREIVTLKRVGLRPLQH
jgi:hypothetical protein